MALIDPNKIISEEERHDAIANVLLTDAPVIPGITCVRHITPLVMTALQRANNPYVTGKKGFEAIGIEFDSQGKQLTDLSQFSLAMMPQTAEVLVLLSCSREELKRYTVNPEELESKALDLVEESTLEKMGEATVFIVEQLKAVSLSRSVTSSEDKPLDSAVQKGGGTRPKKLGRTG